MFTMDRATITTPGRPTLRRGDFIEVTRTDLSVVGGLVAYDRDGTVKYWAAAGLGSRWITWDAIADIIVWPNPA